MTLLRVSQRNLYGTSLLNMNSKLSQLMNLNEQASTQKKVNRPSDDPVATARILTSRDTLSQIAAYQSNIDQAKGWLSGADDTLTSTSTVLRRLKELATQGATGTIGADNRTQISYEARQLFEQLIGLANSQYDGASLFAGHKTDVSPFSETLWMTSNTISNASFTIEGSAASTALIQVTGGDHASNASFRYSLDGGLTFKNGVAASNGAGVMQFNLGGVILNLDKSVPVTPNSATNTNDTTGTWMWIRPTAVYKGDDKNAISTDVQNAAGGSALKVATSGNFTGNVMVKIDKTSSLASNVSFSYSLDGGTSWVHSNTSVPDVNTGLARLVLPGGVMTISSNGGNICAAGSVYIVRPRLADINVNISPDQQVTINNVGKDVFGGVYADPSSGGKLSVVSINGSSNANNMFEVVGKLVGFLETNNQAGCQQALADLTTAQSVILNAAANVGGRENRLTTTSGFLDNLKSGATDVLSANEDVDITELMTKISQTQLAYQAVLQSSSKIMSMSLMNYL